MLIRLNSSKIFTVDPATRFAKEYGVPEELWRELWRRYKFLEYKTRDLCDYFLLRTSKPINPEKVRLWLFRGEIYLLARPVRLQGVRTVQSSFFGKFEKQLIDEILRYLKSSKVKETKLLA